MIALLIEEASTEFIIGVAFSEDPDSDAAVEANSKVTCSLFLSDNLKWKKIEDVFDEKWNQSTIINLVNKHGFSFEEAKELFLHMWLYSNGLATLIATNQIKLDEEKIMIRLVKIYKNLVK